MSVRAKFRVTSISPLDDEGGGTVFLSPVINGSAENEQFYRLTPGGSITLSTVNAAAIAQFVVGGEYYVDFTKAE